jgi:hypothetical protein
MDRHCNSCKKVSRRLAKIVKNRGLGHQFEPENLGNTKELASFGTIKNIFSRKYCVSCRDLAQEITRWEMEDCWSRTDHLLVITIKEEYKYSDSDLPLQVLNVWTRDPRVKLSLGDDGWHVVNLYTLEKCTPQDPCGRLFDTHETDIDMVKGWLNCCNHTHGEYCTLDLTDRLPANAPPARIMLVDLERKCLSYAMLSDKYIALSYVWVK